MTETAMTEAGTLDEYWIIEGAPVPAIPWFTRGNAGETMPDPVTPLGWTLLWDRALLPGWAEGNVSFGVLTRDEIAGDPRAMAAVFGGYFYLNLSAVRMLGVRMPGASVEAIDHGIFGADASLPPYVEQPGHHNTACTDALVERLTWIMTATAWPTLDERFEAARQARRDRPDLAACSDAELVERARSMAGVCTDLYEMHVWTGLSCGVAYGALAAAAAAMGRPEVVNDLVAGLGDIEAAKPVLALWDLSRVGEAHFEGEFERFLVEHGGRGLGDWDLGSPSWEVRPDQALLLLDRMRPLGDDSSPHLAGRVGAERRQALVAELERSGDPQQVRALRAALRAASFFLYHRERSRGGLIKAMNEMRVPMHLLAARHHEAGGLREPADLFLLLDRELDGFLREPEKFAATIADRRAMYRSMFDRRPPYFTQDRIPLRALREQGGSDVIAPAAPGTVIQGLSGGVAGRVTGRARVLTSPYDERGIETGDVIVARQTDPSWTPLFVQAGAVVVDFGSPISHAVIVGRELNTPCVVSAENASQRIPDGATVLVDGSAGTVTVL